MKKKSLMKRIRSGNTIYPDDSLVTRFYRQENCEMKLKKINAALGLLSSDRLRRKLDSAIYVVGAVCFLVASFIIMKGQISMFLMG